MATTTFSRLVSKVLAVEIPFAQLASSTVGAILLDNFRAKLHKEFSRFWDFNKGKKQLLEKLSFTRGFLEFAGTHDQITHSEATLDWLCEIEKRVSDAEAALREIGEDDPDWRTYRRCHAISIEQHREKLDEINSFGTRFYLRSGIRQVPVWNTDDAAADFARVFEKLDEDDGNGFGDYHHRGFIIDYGFNGDWLTKEKVSRVFDKFDSDGDGKISALELKYALRSLGCVTPAEELKKQMDVMVDADGGDGLIDLKQFNELWMNTNNNKKKNPWLVEEFEMVFEALDANGDGKISFPELTDMFREHGCEISEQELKMMMDKIDTDGDGFIDVQEFTAFYLSGFNESKELKMLLKKLGKKKRSIDEPSSSSMMNSSESGTGRKLKKMRTQLKA